jgi:hypothetical protein
MGMHWATGLSTRTASDPIGEIGDSRLTLTKNDEEPECGLISGDCELTGGSVGAECGPKMPLVCEPTCHCLRAATVNREKHLIQMPLVPWLQTTASQLVGIPLTEFPTPFPDGFVRDNDASAEQQLLDIAIAQAEAEIEPHRVADDLGRKAMILVTGDRWVVHAPSMAHQASARQAAQQVDKAPATVAQQSDPALDPRKSRLNVRFCSNECCYPNPLHPRRCPSAWMAFRNDMVLSV